MALLHEEKTAITIKMKRKSMAQRTEPETARPIGEL